MRIPLGHRNWERRMDTELRFHLDQQIRGYMDRGLNRAEAERRARQEFGTLELAKDECRDQRAAEWLSHILRDVRHACRSLWKSPGFAAAVVVTLALGIGANTAIFSLIYSVLLKPLPYPAPDRIFSAETVVPRHNEFPSLPMRVQDYLEWRKANTAFESIAALTPAQWNLTGGGEPERLGGAVVSANFFTFLGALAPAVQRRFGYHRQDHPAECRPARCGRHRSGVAAGPHWHAAPPDAGLCAANRCLEAHGAN
jgi:putative ABC transport system permease protein